MQRSVLNNGLTLVTREERGLDVVAIETWVKAGYFHESDEVAGMAHLLEHMFFKGSEKFPGPEEIARHVSSLGGISNAGTIYDSTSYYFVLPREGFASGLAIQADAIAAPRFDPEELRKEAEVVIEESNRKLDNPSAVAFERMLASAFTTHRIRRWRIGSHDVLRTLQRDHLIEFFESLYRPENIILSIAGGISHEEVRNLVEPTFGMLPRGELRKERGPAEPDQQTFRFGESTADILHSHVVFGWHAPGDGHADAEALELLATVLGAGRYSRLYRAVVAGGPAHSVSSSSSSWEDVGIFSIAATADPSRLREVERQIVREIEAVREWGVTEFELQLARNRIESALLFDLEDVLGQARSLAFWESRGSYLDLERFLARVLTVSREEVQEAAVRYLDPGRLTLFRHQPSSVSPSDPDAVREHLETGMHERRSSPPEPLPLPPPGGDLGPAESSKPFERFVLSNGIPVLIAENPRTPTVSIVIAFKGGRIRENGSIAGITQLMTRTMRRGTRSRSAEVLDREVEFLGTSIGAFAGEDDFGFAIDVIREHTGEALELLADIVTEPALRADDVAREKELQIAAIQRSMDSSSARPFQLFFEAFYGNHPYALPEVGYPSSVAATGPEELRAWWNRNVVADDALIVLVGDLGASAAREATERLFGNLGKSHEPPRPHPELPRDRRLEVIERRERRQSAIVIGVPAVPPGHPDWIALRLLQSVASGLAGTFFAELRGRQSLCYTVYAGEASNELAGVFVGYIATDVAKEAQAREGLLRAMRGLAEGGVSLEDLERAKSYLAGTTRIRLQSNEAMAFETVRNLTMGLGLDFTQRMLDSIRILTLEEVAEVAKRYLSRDNETVAIVSGRR